MSAGSIDPTFHGGVPVTAEFLHGPSNTVSDDVARGMAVQSDGKIVVAGDSYNGSNYDFALARYNTDGTLDTSFHGDGKATVAFGSSDDQAYAVVIQPDGKIVVAGRTIVGSNYNFALARFNTNGSLDTSFDGDGKLTTALGVGNWGEANCLAIQPDGKIVAAGRTNNGVDDDVAVARYNTNGSLDTTFNGTGKFTTAIGSVDDTIAGVVIQPDGKIVLAGSTNNGGGVDFVVARLTATGGFDGSFGSGGKVTTPIGTANDFGNGVTMQPDGKIVVVGQTTNASGNWDFALARYTTTGNLDSTFGSGGKVTTGIGTANGNDFAYSLALQFDGKIIVAGQSYNGSTYDFALARYNPNGSPDITFSDDGQLITSIGSGNDIARSVLVPAYGKILVAGYSHNGTNNDFAVVRYNASDFTIIGTSANDTILVEASGGSFGLLTATINGVKSAPFLPTGSIEIDGLEGDDVIIVAANVYYETVINGGPGNDTIAGGSGNDFIVARDQSRDSIDGGLGIDKVDADSLDVVSNVEYVNPIPVALDNQTKHVNVLVLNFEPTIPSQNNKTLWQYFGWNDPRVLATNYEADLERSSGGAIDFNIVEWRDLNEFPAFVDGYRYSPDEYVQNRTTNTNWHDGQIDFPRIVAEQAVVPLIDSGAVDELWLFGDHYFVSVIGETWMSGPGAFYINGPTFPQIPSQRPFTAYGFNYERGVAEMIHDLGHRTESTMNRIYGGWNLPNPTSNWDRFSANVSQSSGLAGVGTTHWPANATADYDYNNSRLVSSWADDYLNYPNLTGATALINNEAWTDGSNLDPHRDYQNWYFTHLPRAAGVNPDGKQNNWWKYVYDFSNYDQNGQPNQLSAHLQASDLYNLGETEYTFAVAYSGAIPIDIATIDGSDVFVTGPNGYNQHADLVRTSDQVNDTSVVATYRISAPGGMWKASDRGEYTVNMNDGEVRDVTGNALAGGSIGKFQVRSASGAALASDVDTTLLLHMNDSLIGEDGEVPVFSSGISFEAGELGQAARTGKPGFIKFFTAGNIDPSQGTIEFWVKPNWNGQNNGGHAFFRAGQAFNNGILLSMDGADNLRFIEWGDDPSTGAIETAVERGVSVGGGGLLANQWYHIAATWNSSSGELAYYLNGQLAASASNGVRLPYFGDISMFIGSDAVAGSAADAVFDEFRISSRARSATEIKADYDQTFSASGLTLDVPGFDASAGSTRQLQALTTGSSGQSRDVSTLAHWSSNNPAVATVSASGNVTANSEGSALITAQFDNFTATATITVLPSSGPHATFALDDVFTIGGNEYRVTVTYSDNTAVNVSSLGLGDLHVANNNGFSAFLSLLSVDNNTNGSPRNATYRFTPPGGFWDAADRGTYIVSLVSGQVRDTSGNANTGEVSNTFQVYALTPAPLNHAPVLATNTGIVVLEGGTHTITAAELNTTDKDNSAAQLSYTVTSLPLHGALKKNGVLLVLNGTFSQQDILDGKIVYLHDGSETTSDGFGFQVSDGASTIATTRVSLDSSSVQGNDSSSSPSLSANGRLMAFSSYASNLVAEDTNGESDVFVRDLVTGMTTRVSLDSSGGQGNSGSYSPSISADGRFVAFESIASNLVTGDTNGAKDIFVRDLVTSTTTRVSVDSSGGQGNAFSVFPSLSADSRFVAFESAASNLVAGDTNGAADVFVHDRQTGQTNRVSVNTNGVERNGNNLQAGSISADGRYVAYGADANNLVAGDTNGFIDVFVYDRQTGQTTRVSVDSSGEQGNSGSNNSSISADGRFVAYDSEASNLVAGDTNGTLDVFIYDRQTGQTTRVSVDSSGGQGNSHSSGPSISADGRYVAFTSYASNLVVGDTNNRADVFIYDRQTGQTTRVSVDSSGGQGNSHSSNQSISVDGRFVAFTSDASNLVVGDTNFARDVFVRDTGVPTASMAISITPQNLPPTEIRLSQSSLMEDWLGNVVGAISVVDPNSGDTHTLEVNDSRFEMVAGLLRLKASSEVIHDTEPTIEIAVKATDSGIPTRNFTQSFTLTVLANPHSWQNPANRYDIDRSGTLKNLDFFLIASDLKAFGSHPLPAGGPTGNPRFFYDVDGDGAEKNLDAFLIAVELKKQSASGEGEGLLTNAAGRKLLFVPPLTSLTGSRPAVGTSFAQLPESQKPVALAPSPLHIDQVLTQPSVSKTSWLGVGITTSKTPAAEGEGAGNIDDQLFDGLDEMLTDVSIATMRKTN